MNNLKHAKNATKIIFLVCGLAAYQVKFINSIRNVQ